MSVLAVVTSVNDVVWEALSYPCIVSHTSTTPSSCQKSNLLFLGAVGTAAVWQLGAACSRLQALLQAEPYSLFVQVLTPPLHFSVSPSDLPSLRALKPCSYRGAEWELNSFVLPVHIRNWDMLGKSHCYPSVAGERLLSIPTWWKWLGLWNWGRWVTGLLTSDCKSHQLLLVVGVSNFCSKFSYQPCYWCLPWSSLRRQPGRGAGYSHSPVGHLLYSRCCTRVAAREDEASVLGSTHFMGTGWPLCSKLW